ncbi:MAG: RNA polymerase sigma factor [Acidimicrobiales bacterium]
MRDDPAVVDLVERARSGDQAAWDAIVDRYAPLVWSVCRRYNLSGADADDVGANTWLRLVERLGSLREPAALPGWLATTTARECLQSLRKAGRSVPTEDDEFDAALSTAPDLDSRLELEERQIALRAAFAQLSDRCRHLLELLFADPPVPYVEVGPALGVAVGAIGAMRQRCLERLRRSPAMAGLAGEVPA